MRRVDRVASSAWAGEHTILGKHRDQRSAHHRRDRSSVGSTCRMPARRHAPQPPLRSVAVEDADTQRQRSAVDVLSRVSRLQSSIVERAHTEFTRVYASASAKVDFTSSTAAAFDRAVRRRDERLGACSRCRLALCPRDPRCVRTRVRATGDGRAGGTLHERAGRRAACACGLYWRVCGLGVAVEAGTDPVGRHDNPAARVRPVERPH